MVLPRLQISGVRVCFDRRSTWYALTMSEDRVTDTTATSGTASGACAVTVIITNYNYARFLRCAIDSVLAQTIAGVECIVVDDGSNDGSQEIIESYSAVRAIHQRNQGQAAALRAGARIATGHIIISLDADDFLYPQACERVIAAWSQGVSCVNYRLDVYQDEKKVRDRLPNRKLSQRRTPPVPSNTRLLSIRPNERQCLRRRVYFHLA